MTEVQPIQVNGVIKGHVANNKDPLDESTYPAPCSETGLDGPDQVLAADSYTTTKPDGCVRIRFSKEDGYYSPPMSVPGLLSQRIKDRGDHVALIARPDSKNSKKTYTYQEYEKVVKTVAKAFLKLGLERHHGVCILGFNSPEWFIADLGAIYAGGYAVGIYTTNNPEACQYCAEDSQANIIVVEDNKQLEKILKVKENLPHLKAIIMYDDTPQAPGVLTWEEVVKMGEKESDDQLNAVLKTIGVNECCTLIYTSGTVGQPKAVMLSHDNLIQNAKNLISTIKLSSQEVLVSYLPLSHVAAQVVDIYTVLMIGGTIYFADKNALKGTLIETLHLARPTVFVGVPRVWEKIYEKMQAIAQNNGMIKTWIASWAKSQALYYNMNKINGTDSKHWGYLVSKWLIFNKIRVALGLDRCKLCVNAAAPLSTDIKRYFLSLDIIIAEAYGMSECAGAHTLSTNDRLRLGSVGLTLSGFHSKIDNPDSNGEGEICMRGRHVFMGYLNKPDKTAETLDENGWLHSGDLGKIDSDAYLHITGRIKELIITAGGENISPVYIEQLVLAELPALSNAILIGDKRKFLSMLVTLKTEVSTETGEPKDTFTAETLNWLKSIGSTSKTLSDVLKTRDPVVYEEIDKAIKRANTKTISNAQRVQKFQILPHDFSIPTGELGPTLKLKRNVVHHMYENLIEDMYT